jgi:hypothetical protein
MNVQTMTKILTDLLTTVMSLPPINGITLWCNYDDGDDYNNDGLAPDRPLKTLSRAVTLVQAFQTLKGTLVSSTYYTAPRCRIMICAGATRQPAVTALASFCDYIGVGASPLGGDGTGIARIGNGITSAGVALSVALRGAKFKNLQFLGGAGYNAFTSTSSVLRCTFEDCSFSDDAATTTSAMNAGMAFSGAFTQNNIRNCRIGLTHTATYSLYGMLITGQFSENTIENCIISGVTNAISISATQNCVETVIRNCVIGDTGGGCAVGIHDHGNGLMMLVDNRINAADGIESAGASALDRKIGNIVNEGTSGSRVSLYEAVPFVRTT